MKKILFSLSILLGMWTLSIAQESPIKDVAPPVQTESDGSGPIMQLDTTVVDYGTIKENADPLRLVKFTNTGDEPLVITNARGSCGCTVPTWPKEPIMPGESSQIEIRYATNRIGPFTKKVTLTTNEGGDPRVLTVTGKVLKEEKQESVPASEPSMLAPKGGQ